MTSRRTRRCASWVDDFGLLAAGAGTKRAQFRHLGGLPQELGLAGITTVEAGR